MKTLIRLTGFYGEDIFIVTDKIVAFFSDNKKGKVGSKIWVGQNEDDYFYVMESPQEIIRLMYGLSEVPSWLKENGGGNDR